MSENVCETLLVMEIADLRGKTATGVLPYFREKLGEPDELDEYNGKVHYFDYTGELKPVCGNRQGKNYWGIAYVINKETESYESESNIFCLGDLLTVAKDKFFVFFNKTITEKDIIFADLHWYNGVDPPDVFKEIKKII
jgi:hypothetical protein